MIKETFQGLFMCIVFAAPCLAIAGIVHLIPYPLNWMIIGAFAFGTGSWAVKHLV